MVDIRAVAAAFATLTVLFAGSAGYFATNPVTVISTQVVTSIQTGSVMTSTQLTTVTNVVTSLVSASSTRAVFSPTLAYKQNVGFYLTNSSGWTLYLFKRDIPTNATSSCYGACLAAWPAFYAANVNVPAELNASDFTTVTRTDGVKQLAYKGWPLYYYVKDLKPGDTVGNGVGNVWFVCCNIPPGAATTTTTTTTTAATTSSSASSSTATGATNAFKISIVNGAAANTASPGYSPATVTLVRGVNATVTWTNDDPSSHTVTSVSVPTGAQPLSSGNMKAGATYTVTFTVSGTYTYHCDYHSWMTATIIVR